MGVFLHPSILKTDCSTGTYIPVFIKKIISAPAPGLKYFRLGLRNTVLAGARSGLKGRLRPVKKLARFSYRGIQMLNTEYPVSGFHINRILGRQDTRQNPYPGPSLENKG